jgi:type VI secretion system protein ImpF
MADQREADRLQPSLLDRLTDDAPGERSEARDRRVIDMRRLRDIVRRDLAWLLNTTNKEDAWPLDELPNLATSTLNYGMSEISGKLAAESTARDLERRIRRAIEVFEPRVIPATLTVSMITPEEGPRAVIAFDIHGEIWGQPLPLEIYMRTELDVASGDIKVDQA